MDLHSDARLRRLWEQALPYVGAAATVAAVLGLAFLLDGLLRTPTPRGHAHLDRVDRVCRAGDPSPVTSPRMLLFDRVFSDRTPWADSAADRWVDILTGDFAPRMRSFLARARGLRPEIEPVLERHGVPKDFLYLAVIESGMNPHAVSSAQATGMWQFMDFTAREVGLEVGWAVDERRDPVASTDAAARYLRLLYDELGDWALAAAAYNAGPGRVRQAMGIYGEDSFWGLAEQGALPRETSHYVPKLIAAAHIDHDPIGTGLDFVGTRSRPAWRTASVDPASSLDGVARAAGTARATLDRLNPHLIRGISPPTDGSTVRVPADSYGRFLATYFTLPAEERRGAILHEVRPRETLARIAHAYDVDVDHLVAANSVDPRRLRVGQTVRVPAGVR